MHHYITATQAAKVLGLRYHTLMARVRRGRYSPVKVGVQFLFKKSDIEKEARLELIKNRGQGLSKSQEGSQECS